MMIYQYTAAALVSEHKVLAHPASADSIPTSANQEDHVSMGSISARHARAVLEGVERILAIELVVAAQALDLRLVAMPRTARRLLEPGSWRRIGASGRGSATWTATASPARTWPPPSPWSTAGTLRIWRRRRAAESRLLVPRRP